MTDSTATTGLPTDDARALADEVARIIYRHVKSETDKHFIDRQWLVGVTAAAQEIAALRRTAPVAGRDREPVVSIKPMRLSDGRMDYFVSIKVGNREVTPHVFREEYKATFHVALYDWLLNDANKPEIIAFGPDDWPARIAISQPAETPTAIAEVRADDIRAAIENLGYDLKLREFAPRTEIGIRNFNERCEYLASALSTLLAPVPAGMREADDNREPRFYIDHGVIHDRVTGKHVVTNGEPPFEDGIEQVLALLNSLDGGAALALPAGRVDRDQRSSELRAALKPFAEISLARDTDPNALDMIEAPDLAITPNQIRAARAVLQSTAQGGEG